MRFGELSAPLIFELLRTDLTLNSFGLLMQGIAHVHKPTAISMVYCMIFKSRQIIVGFYIQLCNRYMADCGC